MKLLNKNKHKKDATIDDINEGEKNLEINQDSNKTNQDQERISIVISLKILIYISLNFKVLIY